MAIALAVAGAGWPFADGPTLTAMASSSASTPLADYKVVFAAQDRGDDTHPPSFQDIYTMNGDGSNLQRLRPLGDGVNYDWPTWAFNGTKIVFTARRTLAPGGEEPIYLMNADGTGAQRLTFNSWRNVQPKVSPDGTSLLFNSGWDEFPRAGIYRLNLQTGEVQAISGRTPGAFNDADPRWSADGTHIVFASLVTLKDGLRPTQIFTMRADGTDRQRITTGRAFDTDPALSPDGRYVAIASYRGAGHPGGEGAEEKRGPLDDSGPGVRLAEWNLILHNIARGTDVALTQGADCLMRLPSDACGPADGPAWVPVWLPDGHRIAYISGRSALGTGLYVIDADGSNARTVIEIPGKVINWHDWTLADQPPPPPELVSAIRTSPPPRRLLFIGPVHGELKAGTPESPPQLVTASADHWLTSNIGPLVDANGRALLPDAARWTPDRSAIVFSARIVTGESPPADPTPSLTLTPGLDDTGDEQDPQPGNPGDRQVFMVNADGSNLRQLTTPATQDALVPIPDGELRDNIYPDVSPDGRYVLFTNQSRETGESWLLRLDLKAEEVVNLSSVTRGVLPGIDARGRYSPDGGRIAFIGSVGFDLQLFTMAADGEDVQRLSDDDLQKADPSWSPDGKSLVYATFKQRDAAPDEPASTRTKRREGTWSVVKLDLQSGERQVVVASERPILHPVWTLSGAQIAYISYGPSLQPDIYLVDPDGRDPHPMAITLRSRETFFDWR